ncbi:putative farnesyl-diphosphate farnesyltransferase [Mrakia frigida]|uniref:bifunctional farnesyl-diphosphate farnesyltransferase/squalene synthase n=1 Tax=Mrakia frigida TaxID=29902 RepID=UPI003FCBFBDF
MGAAEYVHLLFTHPNELRSILQYAVWYEPKRDITSVKEHTTSGWDRQSMRDCWAFLDLTSRSFAAVIKELDGDLARVICLFYLVLRALDTIEDDMSLSNDLKLPLLRSFHEKLYQPGWNFDGNGEKEKDRSLLVRFEVVIEEFQNLDPSAQKVIADIARKMGNGMADFAALATPSAPVAEVQTLDDFSLYCHYVAGLVGEGLSRLFASTGKERPWIADQLVLSNSLGLLLQKTNILRDIKEDADDGRGFWPREVWGNEKYGKFSALTDLVQKGEQDAVGSGAMWVLSAMTVDAIGHATDALDYLSLLKNQSVFTFCAIPAVMAMATLELCFMNDQVFKRNVKIRKGEAVQLIMKCTNPRDVAFLFRQYARRLHAKSIPSDPSFVKLSIACGRIEQWTEHQYPSFINLVAVPSSNPNAPTSNLDPSTNDARLRIAATKAIADSAKLLRKKERERSAWRVAKGLPPLTAEETKRLETEGEISYVILAAAILGLLLLMGFMAGMVAFAVWYFTET